MYFVHVIYGFFESYKNFYLFQSINKSSSLRFKLLVACRQVFFNGGGGMVVGCH